MNVKNSLLPFKMMLIGLVVLLSGCTESSQEQDGQISQSDQARTVEETTIVERTVFKTVMEEPESVEEADALMGERVTLGGIAFQIFDWREEDTVYYVSGPESPFASKDSANGRYLAIDYFASNESSEDVSVTPEAVLTDSKARTHEADTSIDPPTDNSGGFTIRDDQYLSSTLYFDVPDDVDPEVLTLSFGGDETTIDLTERNSDELGPTSYMSVYTLWFDQRAYDNIYRLFEPSSTGGISEDDWVSYFEPLWGEWYLSLDTINYDVTASTENQSFSRMDRTFYESSGITTPSSVDQELIKYEDEWKFVMRPDQIEDILGTSSLAPVSPAPEESMPEFTTPVQEETIPPLEQYDPPDPDPDPDPDRKKRPNRPNRPGGSNNSPDYPSDGGPGGPDKDCSDFNGPVSVSPGDPYDLDDDGDGTGCDIN